MSRTKRRNRMTYWDKTDYEVLEATSETFRIEVDLAFQKFRLDDSLDEHSFPPNLTNLERKYIHQKAANSNLSSKSKGKDPTRIITVYKRAKKSNFESFYVDLSKRSLHELRALPKYEHGQSEQFTRSTADKIFGKLNLGPPVLVTPPLPPPEIKAFQADLPIFPLKPEIVKAINEHDVVIITSETGSGKTTQIPQYILDDHLARGERCRVICTQPRRISAIASAERVSLERGKSLGNPVGYHIRMESKLSSTCNLIYVTNGVLIRSLMSGDQVLQSLTHIIIDEIHERDKLSDFLLICLRQSLQRGFRIKIVLMSATMNVEKFLNYFPGSYMLNIPGRLFTIEQYFLENILKLTNYDQVVMERRRFYSSVGVFGHDEMNQLFDDILMQCLQRGIQDRDEVWTQLFQYIIGEDMPVDYRHSGTGLTALIVAVDQDNIDVVEKLCNMGADPLLQAKNGVSAMTISERRNHREIQYILNMGARITVPQDDLLSYYYKTCADEHINFELLIKLIVQIHTGFHKGAILVFLPGYDDIMICGDRLLDTDLDRSSYKLFFLHGSMNMKDQNEVFSPLMNMRKIILSTNIAETSITINDVVYVIDCGKAKVQSYDSCSGLSSLQTQWISKACAKQRAGRAGRTQGGVCFHLFSKARHEALLDERIPEILRVPLEELCLNTKTVAGQTTSIYDFLQLAPDPPSSNTVKIAIENLVCLGALDDQENLTPLGEYLSQLNIEPHLGKMLIYAVIFQCIDPVLTIISSLAQKDPFQLPAQANLRSAAAEKRRSLMEGTNSEHLIYLKAFMHWQESLISHKERSFCRDYFISPSTMDMILKTRTHLLSQMRASSFITQNQHMMRLNTYSDSWPLIKAVIAAGLYPKLAFNKNGQYCTRTEKKVIIHNSFRSDGTPVWFVYDDMVKVRNGHQIRGVSPVIPLTIGLMCGVKVKSSESCILEIDEWLDLEFPHPDVIQLRFWLDSIIQRKLAVPSKEPNQNDLNTIGILVKILTLEENTTNMAMPGRIGSKPKFLEYIRHDAVNSYHARNGRNIARRRREEPLGGPSQVPIGPPRGMQDEGACALPPPVPHLSNAVFLLITSKKEGSVEISQGSSKWIFSPQTEKKIVGMDNKRIEVYLVFNELQAKLVFGIAKFLRMAPECGNPSVAKIQWIFTNPIPFKNLRHLRNPLFHNRLIYDGPDGQIIENQVAFMLYDLFRQRKYY